MATGAAGQMQGSNDQFLHDAIARNSAATLLLPGTSMIRTCKSRFLDECDAGFWMESAGGDRGLIEQLIRQRATISVHFQAKGAHKLEFGGRIVARDNAHRVNSGIKVPAVCVEMTSAPIEVQRRNYFRVRFPGDNEISLTVWRIAEEANLRDSPAPADEIRVTALDLSARGAALLCHTHDNPNLRLAIEDRLRLDLAAEHRRLVLEARLRTVRLLDSGCVRLGVEFSALQSDLESRKMENQLIQLIGDLQRRELRARATAITMK